MERLTPLADAFLEAEDVDRQASLAIGSLAIFAGPAPAFMELVRAIEGRLPLIPRYRQRLAPAPFGLTSPAWVDDPDFDIRHHLRQTPLCSPGGAVEVGELMSSVMTERMDRRRPLWDYRFVEGLADGRWALLSKVHHSMVDGVSGSDLYHLLLDATPVPGGAVPDHWSPAPLPSPGRLALEAVQDLVGSPARIAAAAGRALRSPRRLIGSATGLVTLAGALRPVHSSSLRGPLEGARRYMWTTVSLEDVRTVRTALDATVNDVALACVTGGFRSLLLSRGETPDAHALRTLVPVSTRSPGQESILDNRVSLMLPYLPVDVVDPRQRLDTIRERIRSLRGHHEPEAGQDVTTAAAYVPFPAVSWGVRLGLRLPQHFISTVTTNVPGPRDTLFALGRELEELLPYVPIADQVRVSVVMLSYRDALTFGITGDHDSTPDLDVLAAGIGAALAELVDEARDTR